MLKRLSTVLLSAGLLLGLTPTMASAAYQPLHHDDRYGYGDHYGDHYGGDDHYRCWYHCGDNYEYRYRRYRPGECWYHDRYGWYRARCRGYDHDHYYGGGGRDDGGDGDSDHAGGGYNSHRDHEGP